MNKLSMEKQVRVIGGLVEGCSIRSIERMTGIHRDTIMRLSVRVGEGCTRLMDETMRGLKCEQIQVDELWSYVGKKQRHVTDSDDKSRVGDAWTFVAMDRDTKLVPCFRVGKRTAPDAKAFIQDLAGRLETRCQLSSDGLKAYIEACELAFGSNIDYGQIVKSYEAEPMGAGRYSPPKVVATEKTIICGNPDHSKISTSHIERLNLTTRMQMRRFTRLTNAFSKKIENLRAAVGLHFAHYNLARVHGSLRVTPAMEAGISTHIWELEELIEAAAAN
ncbi:MAG: IS1 family transposase [Pseudomonadota bacterium]